MTTHEVLTPTRQGPLPGTGRLGIVAAYFALAALGTGAATVLAAKALLVAGWHGGFALDSARDTIVGGLLTVGYFRTDRLLSQRQKLGGYAALFCLSGSLLSGFLSGGSPVITGIALAGVALVASVWRHLE